MRCHFVFLTLLFAVSGLGQDGFIPLFNGRDLSGWEGEPGLWRVEKGVVIGTNSGPQSPSLNSFLIWQGGRLRDFELRATVRVIGDNNSGIQYRSKWLPDISPWTISGYQCDIHPVEEHTAMTYEERGRGIFGYNGMDVIMDPFGQRWLVAERPRVKVDLGRWNEFSVTAKGNCLTHRVNGEMTSIFIDCDEKGRSLEGLLAIQLHAGNRHQVELKEVLLRVIGPGELVEFDPSKLPAGAKQIGKPKVVSAQGKVPKSAN